MYLGKNHHVARSIAELLTSCKPLGRQSVMCRVQRSGPTRNDLKEPVRWRDQQYYENVSVYSGE